MAITIIPIPPSHCIIALHNKILFGVASRFVIIVEPVVVIPDILSKKASLIEKFKFENIKGIEPKTAIAIHARVEKRKVCFKFNLYSFCKFVSTNKTPTNIVIKEEAKKL